MTLLVVILVGVGVLLIYAAIVGRTPQEIVRTALGR